MIMGMIQPSKPSMTLTQKDAPTLKGLTAGDKVEMEINGTVKSVQDMNGTISYVIDIEDATCCDMGEYDSDMKRAMKKANYVTPTSKPAGV